MKTKLTILLLIMIPLVGCAALTDYIIPAPTPIVATNYLGVGRVKPFKWFYNSCADNDRTLMLCKVKNQMDNYAYKVVKVEHDVLTEPSRAAGNSAIQGLLGLAAACGLGGIPVAHKLGIKTTGPGQVNKEDAEREIDKAGRMDPEEFKNNVGS